MDMQAGAMTQTGLSQVKESVVKEKVRSKELRDLIEKQGYKCALTGRELTPDTAAADHIQPVSSGGLHIIDNIQILHRDVNSAKGTLNNDEFIKMCAEIVNYTGGGGEKSL